ncbi:hypothetical protein QBC47DRAFT_403417 [Echria macrotheca]|uniref:Uncharacterized protein n=1 Tax=Echria macrotheca TaxID=438768 RepID=A0AAJ0B987_9PEZI|nr:hypothetical protein QBC47DRAFT_403417 [Echria macrotheca]
MEGDKPASETALAATPYKPLSRPTRSEAKALCQAMWDWNQGIGDHRIICHNCPDSTTDDLEPTCEEDEYGCPWKARFHAKRAFIGFYGDLAEQYTAPPFGHDDQVIHKHQDLFDIIAFLRTADPELTRRQCMELYFNTSPVSSSTCGHGPGPAATCREEAFLFAARILTMVTFSSEGQGTGTGCWPMDIPLHVALRNVFPQITSTEEETKDMRRVEREPRLNAHNLVTLANVTIQPTNDLRKHLELDEAGNLHFFHHLGFLFECLRVSYNRMEARDSDGTYISPHIHHEVALEVLHTIRILFDKRPLYGPESRDLLDTLVANSGFDPLSPEHSVVYYFSRLNNDGGVGRRVRKYRIFGPRLEALCNMIPRPDFQEWVYTSFKRHTGMPCISGYYSV